MPALKIDWRQRPLAQALPLLAVVALASVPDSRPVPALPDGAASPVWRTTAPAGAGTGTHRVSPIDVREMVWIPEGSFAMGSPISEPGHVSNEPRHTVTIERGFWIDVDQVTNAAWQRFIADQIQWRKDQIAEGYHDGHYLERWTVDGFPPGEADQPVTHVSWYAARAYALWAAKRLVTEAEWEYAVRAGTSTAFWWGDRGDLPLSDANPWGVRGTRDGIGEWTASLYRPYPYRSDDGREDRDRTDLRTVRSNPFYAPRLERSAARTASNPRAASAVIGFRCAQ